MAKKGKKHPGRQSKPGPIGQGNPSYKGRPISSRDENFALLVKTLFGILQCLHHTFLLKTQSDGQFGKAFRLKVNELDRFVKPACSNQEVKQAVQNVNKRWAVEISKALSKHYTDNLSKFKETAHNLIFRHTLDHERAKQIAVSWAHRNYRKKLDKSTVALFKNIVNEIISTDFEVPVQNATQARTSPHGNGTSVTVTSTLPFRPQPAVPGPSWRSPSYAEIMQISDSKTTVSPSPVSDTDSILAKSSLNSRGPQTPSNLLAQPEPTRRSSGLNCTTPKKRKPFSGKTLRPKKLSYEEHSPAKGSKLNTSDGKSRGQSPIWRAPAVGRFKDRDWVFPAIPLSARTVVIGTSNISRITETPADPSVKLFSFPGAKFRNFTNLFKKASVFPHIERVVFCCGINDRISSSNTYVFTELKRAAAGARRVFPEAQVFFVTPQWSASLPDAEVQNLARLKGLVESDKTIPGLVHLIPPVATRLFLTVHDNIHWTAKTANTLLKHWLQYISNPQKN